MKITLICPKWEKGGLSSITMFKWPPHGLLQLASLTPRDWDVSIIDERDTSINFDAPADLVGLTATTASALRAYEIANEFKKRGVKTIMGGIHASIFPNEALQYVDSIVIGEADMIWSEILADFARGRLKRMYQAILPETLDIPPKRKIRKTFSAPAFLKILPMKFTYLQTGRGCPHNCEFCSVAKFNGKKIRTKSIPFLLEEIKREKAEGMDYIVFVDDNIMGNKPYAKELFCEMKNLNVQWMSQTDIRIADTDVIDLACESGLSAVFLGLESISSAILKESACKTKGYWRSGYEKAIAELRYRGIVVEGAFIFGFDYERRSTIRETVDWALDNKLDLAQFAVLTPLPGTALFERMIQEKRIVTKDWNLYNLLNCVYGPVGEWTKETLEKEVRNAYKRFYSVSSIAKRINSRIPLFHNLYTFISNLEFKRLSKL